MEARSVSSSAACLRRRSLAVDLLRQRSRRDRRLHRVDAVVPESKDERAHKSFDLAGAITVTAGLLALVYGIVKAQEKGWVSLHTGGFFALAIALLGAFVVIELRSAEPLVRLDIFRVRTVRAANVVMFLVAAGLFAMFYFNTLYLQRVLGYSALEAGLAFLPFTAGIIIGAGLSQSLVPKLGAREVPSSGCRWRSSGCSSSCDCSRTAHTSPTSSRESCSRRSGWGSRSSRSRSSRRAAFRRTTRDSHPASTTPRSRSAARSASRSWQRSP